MGSDELRDILLEIMEDLEKTFGYAFWEHGCDNHREYFYNLCSECLRVRAQSQRVLDSVIIRAMLRKTVEEEEEEEREEENGR